MLGGGAPRPPRTLQERWPISLEKHPCKVVDILKREVVDDSNSLALVQRIGSNNHKESEEVSVWKSV